MSTDVNALIVVSPIEITQAMLLSTNVPETDYAAWSGATTYALNARVILTSTHKVYQSLQAANTNKNPVTEPLWWIEVSPTNRWKLFDSSLTSATTQATNITYRIEPGQAINAVAALNVQNATEVNIKLYSPYTGSPGLVYSETIDFNPLPTSPDWWSFFYGARLEQTQVIKTDLPSYTDCILEIEFIGGATLSVAALLIGQQRAFGLGVKYGARVGIQDYSRKETNDFGDTILVQRAFAKRASFGMLVDKAEVDSLQNFLTSVRATVCLWIGSAEYEAMTIYGFYKNFDILINYPEHADCELDIEGLT